MWGINEERLEVREKGGEGGRETKDERGEEEAETRGGKRIMIGQAGKN